MKAPFPILACLLVLPMSVSRAEGPPVDVKTRSMTVPHEIFTLTASQREEIEALGTLTLDSAQWERLRKFYPEMPKRIESVLPVTYNDCTCDIGVYAVQLAPDKVAVSHAQYAEEASLETVLGAGKELFLRVDRRGQFYCKGALVPFQRLLDAVRASKGHPSAEGDGSWLLVDFPLDVTRTSKEVASRVKLLEEAGAGAGWTVHLNDSVRGG
jgi:hypothetical protein